MGVRRKERTTKGWRGRWDRQEQRELCSHVLPRSLCGVNNDRQADHVDTYRNILANSRSSYTQVHPVIAKLQMIRVESIYGLRCF